MQRLRAAYAQHLEHKLVHVLEIPDDFQYMDPELVELLESAVSEYLEQ
ncbi:cellular communication/signal transduction [Pseudomonas graminis]